MITKVKNALRKLPRWSYDLSVMFFGMFLNDLIFLSYGWINKLNLNTVIVHTAVFGVLFLIRNHYLIMGVFIVSIVTIVSEIFAYIFDTSMLNTTSQTTNVILHLAAVLVVLIAGVVKRLLIDKINKKEDSK